MSIKNYGLSGVASELQFGKQGGAIFFDPATATFSVREVDTTNYAVFSSSDINAIDGNISVNSDTGTFDIAGTSISLQEAGVLKFDGNVAISIPTGNDSQRPVTPIVGMIRISTEKTTPVAEYYNGTAWKTIGESIAFEGSNEISVTLNNDKLTISLNTIPVSKGGTGLTEIPQNQLVYGLGADGATVGTSPNLKFETDTDVNKLTVGGVRPIILDGQNASIKAGATDSDLVLLPNGVGNIVVSGVGGTVIRTNPGEVLTLRASTSNLALISEAGDTIMSLHSDALNKVTISGPTAVQYATGLDDNDLVNKYYVDSRISQINGGSFG